MTRKKVDKNLKRWVTRPSSSLISDVWHCAGWEHTYLELKFLLLWRNTSTNTKQHNTNTKKTQYKCKTETNLVSLGIVQLAIPLELEACQELLHLQANVPGRYFELFEYWIFWTFWILNILNFFNIWIILGPHLEANVHRERDDVVVEYHPQQEHLQNPKNQKLKPSEWMQEENLLDKCNFIELI